MIEDTKEYSDAYTQYEASEFVASSSCQTFSEPVIRPASFSIQIQEHPIGGTSIPTEPESVLPPSPKTVMISMSIQTRAQARSVVIDREGQVPLVR
jgi:hypothetical protein